MEEVEQKNGIQTKQSWGNIMIQQLPPLDNAIWVTESIARSHEQGITAVIIVAVILVIAYTKRPN